MRNAVEKNNIWCTGSGTSTWLAAGGVTEYMINYIERLKEADDKLVVELGFKRVDQFFDPDDPSPVKSRDLSNDALIAMITAIIDREPKKPVNYIIRFPALQVTEELESDLPGAVRTYFTYRCEGARRKLRVQLKRIKYGLIYGLSLSAVLLAIGIYLYQSPPIRCSLTLLLAPLSFSAGLPYGTRLIFFFTSTCLKRKPSQSVQKRIINSTIRVEKAGVLPDGMPAPG